MHETDLADADETGQCDLCKRWLALEDIDRDGLCEGCAADALHDAEAMAGERRIYYRSLI